MQLFLTPNMLLAIDTPWALFTPLLQNLHIFTGIILIIVLSKAYFDTYRPAVRSPFLAQPPQPISTVTPFTVLYYPLQFGHIPTIGYSGRLTSYISALKFFTQGRQIFQEGYDKYPIQLFKVPNIGKWEFVVGGGELVEDLRKAGEEVSFHQGGVEVSLFFLLLCSDLRD